MRLKQPKQSRSLATLDRVIDATECLLEKKPIDEVSVAEIVRRAGSSVGSFYARFGDKQALIDYIDEVYGRRAISTWQTFLDELRARRKPLFDAIQAIIECLVLGHRKRTGLSRAIHLYVRGSRPSSNVVARAREINAKVAQMIVDFLLERRHEIRMQHPERGIRVSLLFAVGAIREAILFEEMRLNPGVPSDDELIDELATAFWNHIHTPLRKSHG